MGESLLLNSLHVLGLEDILGENDVKYLPSVEGSTDGNEESNNEGTELDSSDVSFDGSNDFNLEGFLIGGLLG